MWGQCEAGGVWSRESSGQRASGAHQVSASLIWLNGRRAQHRDNGGCPSRPHPETTLSFSLYVSDIAQAFVPSLEPRVSACKQSLCTGPLGGHLVFQQPSVSPIWMKSPLIFIDRCSLLFPALVLRAGVASVGL